MKVANSYASLLGGVSQQVPHARAEGQHTEQVNFLSDPVRGLARRHGSLWQGEKEIAPAVLGMSFLDYLLQARDYRTVDWSSGGKEYTVLVRTGAKGPSTIPPPLFVVYNRTDKVFLNVVRNAVDAALDSLENTGVGAVTSLGKYLFSASNSVPVSGSSVDQLALAPSLGKAVVWVRSGAFSRTFKVTARTTGGVQYTFEHTTPSSSYQGVLLTSDISSYEWEATVAAHGKVTADSSSIWSDGTRNWELVVKNDSNKLWFILENATPGEAQLAAGATLTHVSGATNTSSFTVTSPVSTARPDYTKLVNDRVNAYNAAVTAWIGTSTAAIQPKAIALGLLSAAAAAGLTTGTVVNDSCLYFTDVANLSVSDGGDNGLVVGVAEEVNNPALVSPLHSVGKVVRVRPVNSQEVYYLKAVAKDPAIVSGPAEVTWVEAPGVISSWSGLYYATIVGNNLYVASTATLLTAAGAAGPHPEPLASTAGDTDTNPQPFFVGRLITYLGVFQARLLVGSGGVLVLSKSEDYLNFYRSTVLTLPADDPYEMRPQGSEDDEIRHGVLYDQDLVIFGTKRQYVISGGQALTPTSASMPVMSSYEETTGCAPAAAGGFVFYSQSDGTSASLHQIQPGQNDKSPESFPASSQLATYLPGRILEMVSRTGTPGYLAARCSESPYSLQVFTYFDRPDGRKMDAWGTWQFNPALGTVMGLSQHNEGYLVFFMRYSAGKVYVVADLCRVRPGLSDCPYLDSIQPWTSVNGGTGSLTETSGTAWAITLTGNTKRFIGAALEDATDLLAAHPGSWSPVVGALQDAYVDFTNPYMRDGNGKAILSGRLTVTKKTVAFQESSGFSWEVRSPLTGAVYDTGSFNGRILGDPTNVLGREPVSTGQYSLPVGRETREYSLRISARPWRPLTITSIEWVGQFFNRVQRF